MSALVLAVLLGTMPQAPPAPQHARVHGGRVVDARTGAPVAGAEVSVLGMSGAVRTGDDGRFAWTAAPRTPAVVVVTFRDGRVASPVRVVSLDGPVTIGVEPAVREVMTVTGVAGAIDTTGGAAIARVGPDDLALRHPATLVQAIENIPGAGAIGEGQGAAPVIRGLARGRTLILVDGARATSERRVGPNASFVDPGTMRSVEIARGPGSVAYGSDALGGVIAVRLEPPGRDRAWRGRAAAAFGAGVPERRGEVELSKGYVSGGIAIGARARELDDYVSPSGVVPNSAWRDSGVRLAWEQDLGRSRLAVRWQSDMGRDLGRPRSDAGVMRVTSPVDDSHRLTVSWQRAVAGAFRHVRVDGLFGAASQRTDQDRLMSTAPLRPRSLESSDTDYRDVQLRAVAERAAGRARVQAGVDLQGRYGLRTRDTVVSYTLAGPESASVTTLSIDEANRTGAGLFADASMALGARITASAGARADAVRNRNRGGYWGDRTASATAVAGVVALTAAPFAGVSITAQIARGFRDPTLSDRFYRGPVGRGVVEGNPDLAAETSLQMDVTARLTARFVRAEVAAYRYRIDDLVERYAVNQNLFRFRNRGDARFHGVEASLMLSLPRGFAVELGAQASRGRDGADGTPLDDVAPEAATVILRHTARGRLHSYLRLAAFDKHDAAGPSEVPTPGYRLLDAGASVRMSSRLSLHAVGRNLLDQAYYASAGPRWVYAAGRQGAVTIGIGF